MSALTRRAWEKEFTTPRWGGGKEKVKDACIYDLMFKLFFFFPPRCVDMIQQHQAAVHYSESRLLLLSPSSKFWLCVHFVFHSFFPICVNVVPVLSKEWQMVIMKRCDSQMSTSDQDRSNATSSQFLREPPGQVSISEWWEQSFGLGVTLIQLMGQRCLCFFFFFGC